MKEKAIYRGTLNYNITKADRSRIERKLDELLKNKSRHQDRASIRYPELKPYKAELLDALLHFYIRYSFNKADIFKRLQNEVSTSVINSVNSAKSLFDYYSMASANDELLGISITLQTKQGKRSFDISNKEVMNILIDAMKNTESINYSAFNRKAIKTKKKNPESDIKKDFIRILFNFIKEVPEYKGEKTYSNKQCKVISALLSCIDIDETYNAVRNYLKR